MSQPTRRPLMSARLLNLLDDAVTVYLDKLQTCHVCKWRMTARANGICKQCAKQEAKQA